MCIRDSIIWATDTYAEFGEEFTDKVQLDANAILRRTDLIRPRIQKSQEAQAQRTRKKAEVFTPAWLCNQMNNHCDEDWFGRSGVFNTENSDHTWTVSEGKIEFPPKKKWQHYVDSRRLEITCGEAPYLVSRYDVSTGELIVPPMRRIGMLDRKLRIVNENTEGYDEWLKWTLRAFEACYGYESVSYTHLDVYKRQASVCRGSAPHRHPVVKAAVPYMPPTPSCIARKTGRGICPWAARDVERDTLVQNWH